jgi:hypothetical protein
MKAISRTISRSPAADTDSTEECGQRDLKMPHLYLEEEEE